MEKLIVRRSTALGHVVEQRTLTFRAQRSPKKPAITNDIKHIHSPAPMGGLEGPVRLGNSPAPNADLPRSQYVIFFGHSWWQGASAPHARPPRCASAPRLAEEDNKHDGVYGGTTTGQRLIMASRTESTGSVPPGQGGPSCSVRLPRTVATNVQLRAEREYLRGEPEGRRQDQADPNGFMHVAT
jgi:hypothetical protein